MNTPAVEAYVQRAYEGALIETAEVNLIAVLKPTLTIDGDQYCWLFGSNLQDGVAGFGDSPYLAALDFNKAFYAKLPPLPNPNTTEQKGE